MAQTIIHSEAPNRILDFGGWSDTHFAKTGKVLNFAVSLYANVTLIARRKPGVVINVIDYDKQIVADGVNQLVYDSQFDLLKAAVKIMRITRGVEIYITADVPPGCGTGSSAAISVALINALALMKGCPGAPHETARLAHAIETKELGLECGIQDQLSAAMGGVNYIEMYDYPNARVSQPPLSETMINQLNTQLLLVYEGAGHLSSEVHEKVISNLKNPRSRPSRALEALKNVADDAKAALLNEDMSALAEAMNYNCELQMSLHPNITTPSIERIRKIAFKKGAAALKINGAGGGGSVTLLCKPAKKEIVARALKDEGFTILPCRLSMAPAKAWIVRQ